MHDLYTICINNSLALQTLTTEAVIEHWNYCVLLYLYSRHHYWNCEAYSHDCFCSIHRHFYSRFCKKKWIQLIHLRNKKIKCLTLWSLHPGYDGLYLSVFSYFFYLSYDTYTAVIFTVIFCATDNGNFEISGMLHPWYQIITQYKCYKWRHILIVFVMETVKE
jgi:hypothetical protein